MSLFLDLFFAIPVLGICFVWMPVCNVAIFCAIIVWLLGGELRLHGGGSGKL
jgi:hypothetical protein